MIYLFHGSDRQKILDKTSKLVATLKARKPNASFFTMTEDDLDSARISELSESRGLFESKHVVVLKDIFSRKETGESIVELLPSLKSSENIFIFVEGILPKNVLTKFIGNAERIDKFDLPRDAGKSVKMVFNNFLLSDALGKRDRKSLWILLVKALRLGVSPEEISSALFSGIKNVILAGSADSAEESGLHPYVFDKAKRFAKNFRQGDAENLSRKLVSLYHDAHRGLIDFEVGLETFVLNL